MTDNEYSMITKQLENVMFKLDLLENRLDTLLIFTASVEDQVANVINGGLPAMLGNLLKG